MRIAQFAARDETRDGHGVFVEVDRGVGHVAEFASDLPTTIACAGRGPAGRLPAQLVAEELARADADTCHVVEELVHPGVCGDTPARVRRRVRAALAEVDPASVAQRRPGPHGTVRGHQGQ